MGWVGPPRRALAAGIALTLAGGVATVVARWPEAPVRIAASAAAPQYSALVGPRATSPTPTTTAAGPVPAAGPGSPVPGSQPASDTTIPGAGGRLPREGVPPPSRGVPQGTSAPVTSTPPRPAELRAVGVKGWPLDLARGPGGRIWFITREPNTVGWLEPPAGITTDPSGDLWVSSETERVILRLRPDGSERARYRLPDGVGAPASLAIDPEGVVWGSGFWARAVLRLDPVERTARTVPVPDLAWDLAISPGQLVWVAAFNADALDVIDTRTLAVTRHLPDGSDQPPGPDNNAPYPRRLLADGAGGVWFLRDNGSGIFHFRPPRG